MLQGMYMLHNKALKTTAGIFQNRHERPYVWKCSVTVMATTCFVLLEVGNLCSMHCITNKFVVTGFCSFMVDIRCTFFVASFNSSFAIAVVQVGQVMYYLISVSLCYCSFLSSDALYQVQYTTRKQI